MFDTTEELLAKIRLGEDSELELKSLIIAGDRVRGPEKKDFADELAALGNGGGGVCVLGVDDRSKDVVGIERGQLDTVERWLWEICNDSIKPVLPVRIIRMELPDLTGNQKAVIKLEVPKSLWVHQSPGGYFIRQGSSKRALIPEALARLFQQRSQAGIIHFDEQAVPDTGLESLDQALWSRFVLPEYRDDQNFLRKLKVLTTDDQGRERATVAGILLCSTRPDQFLPCASITAVCYRGTQADSNYQLDAKGITGPLDVQIAEATAFVRKNMRVAAEKAPGRVEKPQFSERAVFEAVVNAVVHRDYSLYGSKIRLFLFNDRLELYSPGALPNSLTLDSLPLRQVTRNEALASLLARLWLAGDGIVGRQHFLERRGEGVPIIIRETEKLAGAKPVYRMIDDAELLLTLPASKESAGLSRS